MQFTLQIGPLDRILDPIILVVDYIWPLPAQLLRVSGSMWKFWNLLALPCRYSSAKKSNKNIGIQKAKPIKEISFVNWKENDLSDFISLSS